MMVKTMDKKKVNSMISDLECVIKAAHQIGVKKFMSFSNVNVPLESLEIVVCALKQMNISDNDESFVLPESWKAAVMKSFMETE